MLEHELKIKQLEFERSKLEIQILKSRLKSRTKAANEMIQVVIVAAQRYEIMFKDRPESPSAATALTSLREILEQVSDTLTEWDESEEIDG